MKKKILMTMMLFVCVFGLTGCNNLYAKPRTLEVAVKEENAAVYEEFITRNMSHSKSLSNVEFTDVDIIENEFIITMAYDETDENLVEFLQYKRFSSIITAWLLLFFNITPDENDFENITDKMIDSINSLADDYDGETVLRVDLEKSSGEYQYSMFFDENGFKEVE